MSSGRLDARDWADLRGFLSVPGNPLHLFYLMFVLPCLAQMLAPYVEYLPVHLGHFGGKCWERFCTWSIDMGYQDKTPVPFVLDFGRRFIQRAHVGSRDLGPQVQSAQIGSRRNLAVAIGLLYAMCRE